MYIRYSLIFICLILVKFASAQEQGIYRHYTIYQTLINPAATGFKTGEHDFLLNAVNTWSGAPSTPVNYTFGYSGSFGDNVGLGLQIMNETNASVNSLKATLNYAYKLKFESLVASIGLSTGFNQKSLRNGVLSDPQIDNTDEYLLEMNDGLKFFDFGLGIHVNIDRSFNIGIALPNMVHTYITKPELATGYEEKYLGNFVGYVSNRFKVSDFDFDIEPGIAIRKVADVNDAAPLLGDINLTGYFLDNKLIGGLSYHFGAEQSGGGILLGIVLNKVGIYYSFDIYTGDYQPYNNGKHEFTIGYKLTRMAKQ